MTLLRCEVHGTPISQGSLKRGFGYSLTYSNDKDLKQWRHMVICELVDARPDNWDQDAAVKVSVVFRFTRPKSHFGARGLLPSAPNHKMTKPDTDKVIRSVGDSIEQSGLIRTDAQIVHWDAQKVWAADGEGPGAVITIEQL
tara:strand:- start:628 stop:1053 length:426 start_codon:yes stop_codon:yes gene_type:complete